MNCLVYALVSTDKQAEKELSIPAPLQAMRQYAHERGWQIVQEFVEAGASARTADRPILRNLLSRCRIESNCRSRPFSCRKSIDSPGTSRITPPSEHFSGSAASGWHPSPKTLRRRCLVSSSSTSWRQWRNSIPPICQRRSRRACVSASSTVAGLGHHQGVAGSFHLLSGQPLWSTMFKDCWFQRLSRAPIPRFRSDRVIRNLTAVLRRVRVRSERRDAACRAAPLLTNVVGIGRSTRPARAAPAGHRARTLA
jgi:hypothetical protein